MNKQMLNREIEIGLQDSQAGRVISAEESERRMEKLKMSFLNPPPTSSLEGEG